MPLINLIESQILSAKRSDQKLQVSKFAFIGAIAIFGSAYAVLFAEGSSLGSKQVEIEAKLKKLKPLQEQIDAFKKDSATLEPRLKTLESARNLTNRWARLMEHLAINTPSNVWLTSFRSAAVDPEKPIHITFNGVGESQTDVSEMMLRTQNAQDLESVTLGGTQEKLFEKTTGVEFEMGGDIVDSVEKKKKPTKEEGDK
ncbi:MAG: PilN domain-containing protein [Armatimonadetes bacterium]|nr:hypothetical protein [Armatimonadota bacterium]MBS1703969.1 PilN domain-containing protein [Armatimonadota bacterium]MBS1727981.1 PilN domain-containing protein [Armatimonadota bacterium]